MKKYKLLKDIIYSKKGCVFEYWENVIISWIENIKIWNCKEVKQLIDLFWIDNKEFFEEIIEKPKTLKDLKLGDIVYYITIAWEILSTELTVISLDWCNYWNVFTSKIQAERELKFRITKRKIDDWQILNDDWVTDWSDRSQYKYFIYYDYDIKKLFYGSQNRYKIALFYFSSEEICRKAIKELEQEILYLLTEY